MIKNMRKTIKSTLVLLKYTLKKIKKYSINDYLN